MTSSSSDTPRTPDDRHEDDAGQTPAAYQRLLHILPVGEDARALPMLADGLHSAVQIANLRRAEFLARWAGLFPGEAALGETVYANAVVRRSQVLLEYVKAAQADEPHYRAARFE